MKKTLTIKGDMNVLTYVPSPNFGPLTASAGEQVANGFPVRPGDPGRREQSEKGAIQ